MRAGDVLVPKETPFGPPDARIAWAEELGNLLVVVSDAAGGAVVVNCPADGQNFSRAVSDILIEYEDVRDPDPFGRGWAAAVERAALEAARAHAGDHGSEAQRWQRVAAAVRRVFEEEAQLLGAR